MRIPGVINRNTYEEYYPSPETLELYGVKRRNVKSEDFVWDKNNCLPLADWCVITLSRHFAQKQVLDELPCQDRQHLVDILPSDLSLDVVVPLISEESYWERRYAEKFGMFKKSRPSGWTWKKLYIEKHVEQLVEYAEPQYNDEEDMSEELKLCAPYVSRLIITQLQAWKPPLTWDKDDIPEIYPIDHINFVPVLNKLINIEELDIIYGMNEIKDSFEWRMFELSVNDCLRLGKAVIQLKYIKILRLHRSAVKDEHLQALVSSLVRNHTIEELDLSNCHIGDHGALNIAKLLLVHPTLKVLNVANNIIGSKGGEGIGYALQEGALSLEELNIKLNPLGHEGSVLLISGILHGAKLKNLIISGCCFEEDTSIRMCNMLTVDKSLKKVDVSNNWFGRAGGEAMLGAMRTNKTLQWLDARETDMGWDQLVKINKLVVRNRTMYEQVKEDDQDEESIAQEEGSITRKAEDFASIEGSEDLE